MAKNIPSSPPPLTATEIEALLLSSDDFGHEMRVGAEIGKFPELRHEHGGTYNDSITGAPRQFDYRVHLEAPDSFRTIEMTVECKNLYAGCPMVVCGYPRQAKDANHALIVSAYTPSRDGPAYRRARFVCVENGGFYRAGGFVGKSIVRIVEKGTSNGQRERFLGKDAEIYDAWSQALSSCVDLAHYSKSKAQHGNWIVLTAVIPVIVIPDDALWTASYGGDGKISAMYQSDSAEVCVQRFFSVGPHGQGIDQQMCVSHFHVCTLKGFRQLIDKLANNPDAWDTIFPPAKVIELTAIHEELAPPNRNQSKGLDPKTSGLDS